MPIIDARELRERTAEVLRQLREQQAKYIVTEQGRPVALLLPVHAEAVEATMMQASKQSAMGGWETYARLVEQMQRDWPAEQRTQDLLDEIRR